MKSVVEVDINVSQARLAALFADPRLVPEWKDDVERYEPIRGDHGMAGSRYRLIPKTGPMVFDVTVQARNIPTELRLLLEASTVTIAARATFTAVDSTRSRLRSEEKFMFKGLLRHIVGFSARGAIRMAHARHIDAFKRFAEQRQ